MESATWDTFSPCCHCKLNLKSKSKSVLCGRAATRLFPLLIVGCGLSGRLARHRAVVLKSSSLRTQDDTNISQTQFFKAQFCSKPAGQGSVTFRESVELKPFLGRLDPAEPPPLNADSSSQEGTSCCACISHSNQRRPHHIMCLFHVS